MKLRIRGNTLRLRLTRAEVATFRDAGRVEEAISLGESDLVYALVRDADANRLGAAFDGRRIEVRLPVDVARAWTESEEVGIESAADATPRILVEKDFACLSPREGEDDGDAFPNPASRLR